MTGCITRCEICGGDLLADLFAATTGDPVCAVCKVRFIGGLPTTETRIRLVRQRLGLNDGEYLVQDRGAEAEKILGRRIR